jgi:hypothetical protein
MKILTPAVRRLVWLLLVQGIGLPAQAPAPPSASPAPTSKPPEGLQKELQVEGQLVRRLWSEGRMDEAYRVLTSRMRTPAFGGLRPSIRWGYHYNLACAAARLGRHEEAMGHLRTSVQEGFSDWNTLKSDTDLDSLRRDDGFPDLARQVRARGDYPWLLSQYAAYDRTPATAPLGFTYQDASHPDLVKFRRDCHLDAVAGQGDDFSRMVRLMRWVHGQVRHDGESTSPAPRDAMGLLEVCKREGRGINCRMMAIILHEAYLAMGFKSRHLTCLPLNELDPDCHVITCVWSEAHQKWLYMDPTFEAYFLGEKGEPLSVEDVRERLSAGLPLTLSPGANWNGKPKDPQEYRNYMAKNLFRIQCPLEAASGYEARPGRAVYVALDPLHVPHPPSLRQGTIVTHHVAAFWAKP